jgi:hypothetical protein
MDRQPSATRASTSAELEVGVLNTRLANVNANLATSEQQRTEAERRADESSARCGTLRAELAQARERLELALADHKAREAAAALRYSALDHHLNQIRMASSTAETSAAAAKSGLEARIQDLERESQQPQSAAEQASAREREQQRAAEQASAREQDQATKNRKLRAELKTLRERLEAERREHARDIDEANSGLERMRQLRLGEPSRLGVDAFGQPADTSTSAYDHGSCSQGPSQSLLSEGDEDESGSIFSASQSPTRTSHQLTTAALSAAAVQPSMLAATIAIAPGYSVLSGTTLGGGAEFPDFQPRD